VRKTSELICSVFLILAATPFACKRSSEPGGGGARKSEPASVKEDFQLAGENVATEHSRFDMGRIQDLFDNDDASLARTEMAKTAFVDLTFPAPRPIKAVAITTGSMDIGLAVHVTPEGSGSPETYTKEFRELPKDPTVNLELGTAAKPVRRIRVEVRNLQSGDGHVHIREIRFS
jgi:hypothetical protein